MEEKYKILLIDDEPDFIHACTRTFEANNLEVIGVRREQVEDALKKDIPDLVLLGTLAPAGEAFRLHQWMKEHSRYGDIPMIVIDARLEERPLKGWIKSEGLKLKAEGYVSKPIEPAELVLRIRDLCARIARTLKILVTDDHTMVRDGICAVLSLQNDMEVVGEAVNGKEAIEKAVRLTPHVVLMDIVMPIMSGLEATKRIVKECPQTKVLILTQYDDEENMFVAKQAGAFGFIPKKAASSDLLKGIRTVGEGRFFPPAFAYVTANWDEGETN